MDPQVGQIINNKYRLLRLIGDGGMGSVFEAKHELLGTTVALKFLHNQLARRKGLVERFLQEAQVSARIRSPHVVSVSDVDRTSDGLAYMVMEYVEGETLQTLYEKLYNKGDRLTYGDAFDIMLQMLEGVSAAHSLGIVHRDLKPDNVMLTEDPRAGRLVRILDFGIAKLKASGEVDRGLTRPGVVMGTPEYMAPEQAFSADKVDARADVFSLGVMFFEMLAGRRPVGGDNAHAIAAQYLEGTIAQLGDLMPSVAPKLAAAVHKAMGAKPDERFDSVDAFRAAIAPYAPDGAGTAASKADQAKDGSADPLAETAGASVNDGRQTPIPKTVPPEEIFSDGGVSAQTAGDSSDSEAPTTDGGTASMAAVGDQRSSSSDGAGEEPSPFRAGTEPMPEGAVQAQLAMRSATVNDAAAGPSGSTQVGEPFSPPGYPAGPGPGASAGVGPAPAGSPNYGASPGRTSGKKKKGPPLLAILAIAAGVSAAVVGGVYVAHEAGAREAESEDPIDVSTPPPATVVQDTPPPEPQPPTVTTPPTPVPPPQPPPPAQPPPPKPQPPSKPPPPQPPPPPPFVIPSALPGLPGLPGLTPPPPPPPPPAQPPPPSKSKKPSIIFNKGGQPKPQSTTGGTDGATTGGEVPKAKPGILRRPPKLKPRRGGASSGSSEPSPEPPDKRPSILFPKLRR